MDLFRPLVDVFMPPDHCVFDWVFDCRFFHHCQASIPTPAIAAFRSLLEPNVSLRTLFRFLFLFPKPNMCTLLCVDAA